MNIQRVLDGESAAHLDAVKIHPALDETAETGANPEKSEETAPGENSPEVLRPGMNLQKGKRYFLPLQYFGEDSALVNPVIRHYPFKWTDFPNVQEPEKPLKVGQSRRGSLLESLVNIVVGASINYAANLLIFPLFGWHLSAHDNVLMVVIYTGISLVRSYGLRRLFNWRAVRK